MDYEALNSSSESDVDDYTSSDNEELIDMEDEYGAGLATMVRGAEPYRHDRTTRPNRPADDVAGHAAAGDAAPNNRLGNTCTDW